MTDTTTPDPAAVAAAEADMRAQGIPTHEHVQADYFGFEEVSRVTLPDGVSYVEHRTLTEGQRRKYLNGINRDVVIQKATGDARVAMRPGDERYSLLKVALCGWNLQQNGQPVLFNDRNLEKFLESAPPKVIDVIDKEVRKANAWLIEDMSVEDIDKEIATLQELRETKLEEDSGN
jgi:hypothetical protein